ncbi:hypothetical protein [Roseivirga echinicomitans]|uniref:Uncharacterized protein n=1 Tax=Roseivirga echinicomitans TaxID=296218 RepID=A0A150XXV5_9BACT|nr:hypothetical protein [Roseivirga echinicomitans]KYG83563.1 hypothetical protein AWN68_01805 [Roseivirga echinicomitans]
MKNVEKTLAFTLLLLVSHSLTGQNIDIDQMPVAEMSLILNHQEEGYDLKLYKFDQKGVTNTSLSKGSNLLKVGGDISKILTELNPGKFIKTKVFRSKDLYFLELKTSEMTIMNDIGLDVSKQIMKKLGYVLKEEKVPAEVWEITIVNESIITSLMGIDVPIGVVKSVSMDKETLHIIGDINYLGLVLAKHYLSDYVFAEPFEGVFAFSIPKGLSGEKLHDFLQKNYGLALKKGVKELDYLVVGK